MIYKILPDIQFRTILLCVIFLSFSLFEMNAEAPATVTFTSGADKKWLLQNESLQAEIIFKSDGSLIMSQLFNKAASVNYLTGTGEASLFRYQGHFVYAADTVTTKRVSIPFEYNASEENWSLGQDSVKDILMYTLTGTKVVGKKLIIPIFNDSIQIRLAFEIYDGKVGLRCQNFIMNKTSEYKLYIEQSEVVRFNFPANTHNLHYVTNTKWYSTTGGVEEAPVNNKGKDVAKLLLNLYDTNDGWYIAPEVNWKTQHGPEIPDSDYEYMHRSFAGATAWATESSQYVQVNTNQESLQLVLFPKEEFEYIPVNITVFKGDIVDGKMAVEEHLRKRYKYNNVRSLFNTNDWDWFTSGNRNETFYKNVVIPKAKLAGIDMLMFDDGWNNANASGNGLDNTGTSRDKIEASKTISNNMVAFTDYVVSQGFKFGLWYSMSGGNHNKGFDLASPEVIAAKKQKVEYLINNYKMTHQMVDLTEYWQICDESEYSHPSDNVYRKNVMTRNMMNELVKQYPQYVVKVTSEVDVYPTQGDRGVELGHIVDNGWLTAIGDGVNGAGGMGIASWSFGHVPMNSIYFGGNPTGRIEDYYTLMVSRNIKFGVQPDKWDSLGTVRLGQFNKWRKSPRITEICEQINRPVYFGKNWDSKVASDWDFGRAPFFWMYVMPDKSRAMMLGTSNGQVGTIDDVSIKARWLDENKTYLVQDITFDDTGIFTYDFRGKKSGKELIQNGLTVNMYQNSSRGKAFWFEEFRNVEKQVVYADHDVLSYTETLNGNSLIVNATGLANTTGKLIVYGITENKTMISSIIFDAQGNGQTIINTIENQPATVFPGFSGSLRYDLENHHENALFSRSDLELASVYNGSPDPSGGYSSFIGMKDIADYVIYQLEIPTAGTYNVSVRFKLSTGNRGTCQWSVIENRVETQIGAPYLQAASSESMKTIDLGNYTFSSPGVKQFKMKLVSGITTGKNLSTDYLTLTLQK